jgi:hypothetical protein
MIFHLTLDHAEDGWIVIEGPALPGCVSQGKDEEEALLVLVKPRGKSQPFDSTTQRTLGRNVARPHPKSRPDS